MALVSVSEAARRLGVSTDTVKRRLKKGGLQGRRQSNGRWMIELPDKPDTANNGPAAASPQRIQQQSSKPSPWWRRLLRLGRA